MTPEQFKSWFEGFAEAIAGIPSEEQWARIKEQVGKLQAKPPITYRENLQPMRTWLSNDTDAANSKPLIARGIPTGGDHVGRIAYGAIAINGPFSHETRVIDQLTGADLGPSD